jgi:uncharacterized protein YfeS
MPVEPRSKTTLNNVRQETKSVIATTMRILPHHEDWELAPENAHPYAQDIMKEDWYWDCGDDYSPFGNDTGADTLHFYSKSVASDTHIRGDDFLNALLDSWGFDPHWELTDNESVKRVLETEPYGIDSGDDAAIAVAFAQLLLQGSVEIQSRDRALSSISRASLPIRLAQGGYPDERLTKLGCMRSALLKAPTR